ncbi:MAG: ABC transporter permease [Planctomycetes bacterium]|nr:ABC transporter permease [Planctomycetota bacterium]
MVIIAGEIDLSVGSAVAFAGCLTGYLIEAGWPAWSAVIAALAFGAATGAFTGVMRAKFNVPSFITSLALLTGLSGAAFKLTGGYPLTDFPEGFAFLGSGVVLRMPLGDGELTLMFPVVVLACVFVATFLLMNYTTFGRSVYAVGGNAEAARLCGISVGGVRIAVLAITGALAALAGVLLASRMSSGSPEVGRGWELDIIAAVIVGGTSLSGGAGRVWGTLVGVIFIGVIVNGMRLLDVQEDGQRIARGVIILLAVVLSKVQQD